MNDGEGKSCATCRSWKMDLRLNKPAVCRSPVVCVDWNQWAPRGVPEKTPVPAPEYGHYFKDVSHLMQLDIYRVLDLFGVTDPCIGHAIKKLLVAGGRGAKDVAMDVKEAADSLERWAVMQEENRRSENE